MYNWKLVKIVFSIFIVFSFMYQNILGNNLEKRLQKNAKLANEAFRRCDNYLTAWII